MGSAPSQGLTLLYKGGGYPDSLVSGNPAACVQKSVWSSLRTLENPWGFPVHDRHAYASAFQRRQRGIRFERSGPLKNG